MYEIMPRAVWHLEIPPPRRKLLFFWGGASREAGNNIRRNLWEHHANTTGFFVPISDFGHRAPPDSKTENVRFDHWMPRSVFCGSPPGWNGGDSNRYLPALVHGCTSLLRGIGGASACLPQTHLGYPITHPKRGSDASPRVAAGVLTYHLSKSANFRPRQAASRSCCSKAKLCPSRRLSIGPTRLCGCSVRSVS